MFTVYQLYYIFDGSFNRRDDSGDFLPSAQTQIGYDRYGVKSAGIISPMLVKMNKSKCVSLF